MFLLGNQKEYLILDQTTIRFYTYHNSQMLINNSIVIKILNDLDNWLRNLRHNFRFKNCLFRELI